MRRTCTGYYDPDRPNRAGRSLPLHKRTSMLAAVYRSTLYNPRDTLQLRHHTRIPAFNPRLPFFGSDVAGIAVEDHL